jgi:hypothetical protein
MGGREAEPVAAHGMPHSISLVLPPLSLVIFKGAGVIATPSGSR